MYFFKEMFDVIIQLLFKVHLNVFFRFQLIINQQTDRQTVKRTYLPNFFEILASSNSLGSGFTQNRWQAIAVVSVHQVLCHQCVKLFKF